MAWSGCVWPGQGMRECFMACKRPGFRVPFAPRFRRSKAVCADLGRLLIVQEVTQFGELAWSDVPAGQGAVTSLIGHSGCGWVLPGAKWGASRLIHVLPKAADGRPGLPAQRRRRHAEWIPRARRRVGAPAQRARDVSPRGMGRGNNRQLKPLIRNSTGQPSCFTTWIWSCPRG
jgi:hypothetical protein